MRFRIVKEETLSYGGTDQLYLMMIQIGERHFIQVDSRSVHIGRIACRSRREAEVMMEQISERMNTYTAIHDAFNVLDLAFQMKQVRPFMFLVNNMNRVVYFNDIWKMKLTYSCSFYPENTDLIIEDKKYNRTIEVTFTGLETPLGAFKAVDECYKFRFEVSKHYLWYIP